MKEALSEVMRFSLNGLSRSSQSSQAEEPFCFYEGIIVPLITISDCELFRGRDQISFISMFSKPYPGPGPSKGSVNVEQLNVLELGPSVRYKMPSYVAH